MASSSLFAAVPPLIRARYRASRRLRRRHLDVYFHPAYRPPVAAVEAVSGFEPRRAEMVATWLLDLGLLERGELLRPERASVAELLRVHGAEHLEAMARPEALARVFAVDPSEVPADELLHTLRLGVGGTIGAARCALRHQRPALNLLGGFHHAAPAAAGGLSVLNDVAIAAAAARADGLRGLIAVLDLDAHPPDGTAACFADAGLGLGPAWIGSLSGARWPMLDGVDETVLPAGCDGADYLEALDALLARMPAAVLTFVLAGGDVLAGDRMGTLGLHLDDAAERDRRVAAALAGRASVWLPAGGYHRDSWRLLASTAALLSVGRVIAPRPDYDPVRARIHRIGGQLALGGRERPRGGDAAAPSAAWDPFGGNAGEDAPLFDDDDLALLEGRGRRTGGALPARLLGFYSAEMLELALHRYGVMEHVRRLGYRHLRVIVERHDPGDRMRLLADGGDAEPVTLIEAIVERQGRGADALLYVHWLTLRHPRARFAPGRAPLPGQDVPGLGLAKEAGELLAQMALRLGLHGVAYRPASLHVAAASRREFEFQEFERQSEFIALLEALRGLSLAEATAAVANGRVCRDGQPWRWPAGLMVCWLDADRRHDPAAVALRAAEIHLARCDATGDGG